MDLRIIATEEEMTALIAVLAEAYSPCLKTGASAPAYLVNCNTETCHSMKGCADTLDCFSHNYVVSGLSRQRQSFFPKLLIS